MRSRSVTALSVAAPLLTAVAAWACSGPGAMALIHANERLGYVLFAVTALILGIGAGLLRRLGVSARRVGLLAVPLLVHPGWWMSARGGDCGILLALGSKAITAVAALVVVVVLVVALVRRRRA